MQSLNFETLRPKYPELADLGGFAEQYVYSDPASAGVKLRVFAEVLTGAIYSNLKLQRPPEDEFVKLLTNPPFKSAVLPQVVNILHILRKEGNQGAHGNAVPRETAMWLLEESVKLGKWFAAATLKVPASSFPPFQPPVQQSQQLFPSNWQLSKPSFRKRLKPSKSFKVSTSRLPNRQKNSLPSRHSRNRLPISSTSTKPKPVSS